MLFEVIAKYQFPILPITVTVVPLSNFFIELNEVDGPLHFSDREKFIGILFKQMAAIHSDQVFMISHSDGIFEGNPVNIIMTSDENVEPSNRQVIIKL